ncbi:hypothetical protein GZL_09182 [Streptomyces sp. 769]|nr:hypothetical protein GZL_09182 [Streptomyces sp. 769]
MTSTSSAISPWKRHRSAVWPTTFSLMWGGISLKLTDSGTTPAAAASTRRRSPHEAPRRGAE